MMQYFFQQNLSNSNLLHRLGKQIQFQNHKTTKTMTTQEVANHLVSLCREGKIQQAGKEL